jgi:hypothetical protein
VFSDTWEWNGTRWALRNPAATPPQRRDTAMAFDRARSRVVLFSGDLLFGSAADTWEWTGTDWLLRTPATRPEPRGSHALAYDSARDTVAMFGGSSGGPNFSDLWEYGPLQPATAIVFGSGCPGSAGTLTSTTDGRPWLGDLLTLRAAPVPGPGIALFWLGTSRTAWGPSALPLPLDFLGMPGCALLASPDATVFVAAAGGIATLTLTIPTTASLAGTMVYGQVAVLDPGANAFGVVTSNGLSLQVGSR